jgi:PAS domain S-box-containing protein
LRILIADDYEPIRREIRSLLADRADLSVCGEAADGLEATEMARKLRPDLILMDMSMPGMNGIDATRIIRRELPQCEVIIVSQNDPALVREQAALVDVRRVVAKADLANELLPSIEHISGNHNSGDHSKAGNDWLVGGGEMGKLIRSMDWSKTPLGPLENWPDSLRTTISLSLSSNFPINIVWGPGYNQIYNDGYRVLVGERHPDGMGMPYNECWASAWPAIGEPFERAWAGETSFLENQRMYLTRNGYLEETFFTFSLSPIRGENGTVFGLFHPVTETTPKMLSERRMRALRAVGVSTNEARSLESAFILGAQTLAAHELDLPFVLFYSLTKDAKEVRLVASAGIAVALTSSPELVRLDDNDSDGWPFSEILATDASMVVDGLQKRFGRFACGPYEEGANLAVACALRLPGSGVPLGIFIAGVSPRLPFNQSYRDHFEQVAAAMATSLANVFAYEQEKQRAEALAEIDRAKTAFFSNISHEFRTPLTLMMGPLEDAIGQAEQFSPINRERLELAHRNSLRLLKLVNTLLDFSRIEAGRIQASYEPTDLSHFTAELASVFRSAIERAGMRLVIHCPALPEMVYIDNEMWEKIVLNLLSNAFKFTFDGEIQVSLRAVDSAVELSVRDTGTGIPAEEITKLFERFHRVKGARGRSYEGSGIGLALVQELVKLHGGSVRVESKMNQGTTFTVSIPLGKEHLPADRLGGPRTLASTSLRGDAYLEEALRWLPEPQDAADVPSRLAFSVAAPPLPSPRESNERARILLADDNADMREYLERLLNERYEVTAVADGEGALKSARAHRPDLVLSDIMMPRLDGFGLLHALRSEESLKDVPVILLSARAGEESRIEGLETGADDYLVKPFSTRELLARVKSHLEMARVRREATGLLAAIVGSSDDAIVSKNLDGVITSWNKGAERIFGYTAQEAIGKNITLIIPPDRLDEEANILRSLRRGERVDHFETIRMRKDGTLFDISVTISPVKDAAGKIVGASKVARDISERKRAVEALQRSEESLRALSEELDVQVRARTTELEEKNADVLRQAEQLRQISWQLLRAQDEERRHIARELHDSAGQMLAVLGMNLSTLVRTAKQKLPEIVQFAGEIQEIVQQLTKEIRTTSYLLHPPLLDENGLASALSWYLRGLTDRSGLDIAFHISEDFGRLPHDMELIVFRVVQECLTNIHRHSGSKDAAVQVSREPDRILVEVRDSGKGISPDKLAEIQLRGSGVGIRGMRERLRQFQGEMIIQSDSAGTTVLVTIPLNAPATTVDPVQPADSLESAI